MLATMAQFPQTVEELQAIIVETMASQAQGSAAPMPQQEIAEAREAVASVTAALNLLNTQQAVMARSEKVLMTRIDELEAMVIEKLESMESRRRSRPKKEATRRQQN